MKERIWPREKSEPVTEDESGDSEDATVPAGLTG